MQMRREQRFFGCSFLIWFLFGCSHLCRGGICICTWEKRKASPGEEGRCGGTEDAGEFRSMTCPVLQTVDHGIDGFFNVLSIHIDGNVRVLFIEDTPLPVQIFQRLSFSVYDTSGVQIP